MRKNSTPPQSSAAQTSSYVASGCNCGCRSRCAYQSARASSRMRSNEAGKERVIDELRAEIGPQARLDIATPAVSLFVFHELRDVLTRLSKCRLVLPDGADVEAALLGVPP